MIGRDWTKGIPVKDDYHDSLHDFGVITKEEWDEDFWYDWLILKDKP